VQNGINIMVPTCVHLKEQLQNPYLIKVKCALLSATIFLAIDLR